MKIISISDLIEYRRRNDKLVEEVSSVPFPTIFGDFTLKLYEDKIHYDHHQILLRKLDDYGKADVFNIYLDHCRILYDL